jgi:hypothetical protein
MRLPPHINESHWQEWVTESGIDPELTKLNLISLKDYEPYDYLLYGLSDSERRNDGRLRDKWLKRYQHIEAGGWWCNSIDILTGEDSQWGCFKPDNPYSYEQSTGFDPDKPPKVKKLKYEHPLLTNTGIFALKVPLSIWQKISARASVPLPSDITVTQEMGAIGFWQWLKANPQIPLLITEGAKKAGALLSAGHAAIALPGIYNGYRQPKDEFGNKIEFSFLIPELKAFAQQGREIIFCFDQDTKQKTIENVRRAIARTGGLLAREGCRVSVITWDYPEKGVDDLIVARGVDCFEQRYKARVPLSKYKSVTNLDLSKYRPLKVNERYLGDNLTPPVKAQIIGLRSPKGTGKTEWLGKIVELANMTGKRALVITHRIQLAKALCSRFGIDHIESVRHSDTRGALGYGLCIDSLHPKSMARFNPSEWEGATVILDEVEQVIWHLLDSATCQSDRVSIIETFQELLKTVVATGGKIYLSDADLTAIALDYVLDLIGLPIKPWVVDNVYQRSQKRHLISNGGNDPTELIANLVEAISNGEKPLIHTTGQKAKSKYGSINLESYLNKQFPHLKVLRIDRESVAQPKHPAYGCMENLNLLLGQYDVVICSPVVETGVSIDIKNHFTSVWAIAYGVQTVEAVCQSVERLREDVPRHIWVKKTAKNNCIGNGSISVKSLLRSQHQLTRANISILHQAGLREDFDDLDVKYSPESLTTWAKRGCLINAGKNDYRDEVIGKLLSEGYELEVLHNDSENALKVKEGLKQTREKNYQHYCASVASAVTPSEEELEELSNKISKTEEERAIERKGNLGRLYGVEVTPLLVERDDNGWYPQLQLHYYLSGGAIYLAEREKRSLTKIKQQGNGKIFKPDLNKKQLSAKVSALELIGIQQFLNPLHEFTKDNLVEWLESVIRFRFELKTIFGVAVNPEKDSAIAVAQRLLKKLGLKLEFKHQIRRDGKPTRVYRGCQLDPDGRDRVFLYWLGKEAVTPLSLEDIYLREGVTAAII